MNKIKLLKKVFWLPCVLLLIGLNASAQNTATVTGTVMNEKGELLPGVTVKATGAGSKESFTTATNDKGLFVFSKLKEGTNYTLTASYVGYDNNNSTVVSATQGGNNSVLIRLQPSNNALNEVVVIGYGTQKRETVTGAITTVRAKDFNTGQINDPVALLSGKVAGLNVSNSSRSDPSATVDFSLRGPSTLGSNSQPLIVIDGVPGGNLQSIAPNDIASIDVLKDGSAASIYGSRATGGVIIVTTKRGRAGAVQVNYSGYVTTSSIAKKYDVLNAQQYVKFGQDNNFSVDNAGANTNWLDAVTRTPISHSHNLSLSGGTDKTTYYASLNYRNLQGIDLKNDREFASGTFRLNTKAFNDKVDFGIIIENAYDNRNYGNSGALAQTLNMNPTYPVKNPDGTFYERFDIPYGLQWNPVASIEHTTNNDKIKTLSATANVGYHIIPSLTAGVSYSLNKIDDLSGYYVSREDFFQINNGTGGTASRSENNYTHTVLETTLGYDKNFGDHHLNAVAGYGYEDEFSEGFSAGNNSFLTDAFLYYNIGAGNALNNLSPTANRGGVFEGSYGSKSTLLSYFGRIIYDYKQRYLLNLSIRREGSSRLGANNKWGDFPGVSAGWILNKENFLANSNVIKNLKLRAGYGITGNLGVLEPYKSLSTIGAFYGGTQSGYFGTPDNGTWILPYGPEINPNPNLRWETKSEINIGLDYALLNGGWLNGSIDVYDRKIKNLLGHYSAQQPSYIFPDIFANAGEMENKGIELAVNARLISKRDLTWNVTLTGAYNKNEVIAISNDQFFSSAILATRYSEDAFTQILAPGQPLAVFYGPRFASITKNGKFMFYNSQNKAVPASEITPSDYTYLGNSIPKYSYGFTNTFTYKHFDASILIKGAAGFKAVNAKRIFHENWSYYTRYNLFTSAINNKLKDNPQFSSYYVEDGSYLKIDNITIGYTIPLKSLYIKNIHVYATGANLLTLTGFSGVDPEMQINYYGQDPNSETDFGPSEEPAFSYYPATRVFTFGVDVNF
ncbi:MAG: SusC/RagA family TonB-linked outer membrane protein [Parafilimonas sp.]|nr:SusC/RagA family TonB-linked outer membrane protein [Parafilimonas sp.]